MRKFLTLALLLTMVGSVLLPQTGAAQDASPESAVGESVPVFSADGNEIGSITINAITDPFEEYDTSYSPQRGYHYVMLDLTVANTSQRAIEFDPYDIQIVDSEGFVATSAFIGLTDEVTTPMLEYTDALAPGTDASGLIPFEVFSGSSVSRVLYAPGFDTMTTIADFRPELAAAGTPVSIIGSSGAEIAQVTVNGVADPFDGYDQSYAPPRGSRFVAVDVTVTNTSSRTLTTSPGDFSATDDIGFKLESPFVSASDPGFVPYDYLDLAPGESQQGVLFYQVLDGIPVVQIIYGDGFSTSVVVADLELGAPQITAQPTAVPVASSPDCEGLVEWGNDFAIRIQTAGALTASFEDVAPEDLDPVAIREVSDQLAVLAQETRDSNPPPAAVAVTNFFAEDFYQHMSDITAQIADALESNDMAAAAEAEAAAEAAMAQFDEGGEALELLNALETECPNEIETLNNQ